MRHLVCCLAAFATALLITPCARADDDVVRRKIAPLLARRCLGCHNDADRKGDISLVTNADLLEVGYIVPGDPAASYLLELVTPTDGKAEMPKDADPLKDDEIAVIRDWISQGGKWPDGFKVEAAMVTDTDWWSLLPLMRPAVPSVAPRVRTADGQIVEMAGLPHNEIDKFIARKHQQLGLSFAPEASRQTLIRRLHFDLLGLPPSPEQIERFVDDPAPDAYDKLVDQLLASPHYGERWARHWLDVVHYGDTHGYDKDKPRPNAWPYRDYVIRSLNDEKPWSRFVQEQVAGDAMFPGTRDGIEALGFIAAGPWDFVGHAEVPESKVDGKVARHLDRDDMVRNTIQSFNSLTAGCAQCHNHKFDPITQEDYYCLQAVFAALDRADRSYYADPETYRRHTQLSLLQSELTRGRQEIETAIRKRAGTPLAELEQELRQLEEQLAASPDANPTPNFGYHSEISAQQDSVKWVQVDLGSSVPLQRIVVRPAFDSFNNIGAGFGFPVRFRVEVSDDPGFQSGTRLVVSHEDMDVANPGIQPLELDLPALSARYIRLTAVKLAARQNDYILALAELQAVDASGENRAQGTVVTALDAIESPPRWGRANLVDGNMPRIVAQHDLASLRERRDGLWQAHENDAEHRRLQEIERELADVESQLKSLPPPNLVYAGTIHQGTGSFTGTGPTGGQPRTIYLLDRGDVTRPGREVGPGTLGVFDRLPSRFVLPPGHAEADRRAALARWLTSADNCLTWRSIVNRVWQYHFGDGLVETPNDFGRMGALPTHPELLDWLAVEFRDGGQSLKTLHKLVLKSYAFRQSSNIDNVDCPALADALAVDAGNKFLWRMNRRKLDAESIRDSVLAVSGKLDLAVGGPAFQDFVIEKPEHSPHYQYHLHDPNDAACHRRSIYRFIVRSQLQPFMNTLDCADPSLQVARRNESLTPLQALAMLNDGIIVTMSKHFAEALDRSGGSIRDKVDRGFYEAIGRRASERELQALAVYAEQYGLANYCRVLFNLNEFSFVD